MYNDNIDRCIYILKPLHYQLLHRGWHILFMTISPLLVLVLFGLYVHSGLNSPLHLDTITTLPFVFFISGMTAFMFIPSFLVFRILRKQRSRMASISKTKEFSRKEELRSFYVCFGCVTTFLVMWSPMLLLRMWEIASGSHMEYITLSISAIFTTINPFSDAFICVWFNQELKARLRSILRSTLGKFK